MDEMMHGSTDESMDDETDGCINVSGIMSTSKSMNEWKN